MLNQEKFKENLYKLADNLDGKRFLLAVSGGADSMVLSQLFKNSDFYFEVAHINYHLRGEDSVKDQNLVEEFCTKNNIRLHLFEVSQKEEMSGASIQIWARNLRYHYFFTILKDFHLDFLVTGHHLNDELETFFINLSRGSGIKGLCGIPANDNSILRPLLRFSKEDIYDFASANNVEFREDLTNKKNDYLRNKIRNTLVPQILEVFPDFLDNFDKSLGYLSSVNHFLQTSVKDFYKDILISGNEDKFVLNKIKLLQASEQLSVEVIRKLGFSGQEIHKILRAENGKFFRSNTHEIRIGRNDILCTKRKK